MGHIGFETRTTTIAAIEDLQHAQDRVGPGVGSVVQTFRRHFHRSRSVPCKCRLRWPSRWQTTPVWPVAMMACPFAVDRPVGNAYQQRHQEVARGAVDSPQGFAGDVRVHAGARLRSGPTTTRTNRSRSRQWFRSPASSRTAPPGQIPGRSAVLTRNARAGRRALRAPPAGCVRRRVCCCHKVLPSDRCH